MDSIGPWVGVASKLDAEPDIEEYACEPALRASCRRALAAPSEPEYADSIEANISSCTGLGVPETWTDAIDFA